MITVSNVTTFNKAKAQILKGIDNILVTEKQTMDSNVLDSINSRIKWIDTEMYEQRKNTDIYLGLRTTQRILKSNTPPISRLYSVLEQLETLLKKGAGDV